MFRFGRLTSQRGATRTSDVIIISVVVILAVLAIGAFLLPMMFGRTHHGSARKDSCQNNMKELGLALNMYYGDYDATLPSSFLYGGSKTWDANNFSNFASVRGYLPPPPGSTVMSWPMVLYPYMRNKDIIWCPSDPDMRQDPAARVSYYYKAAVDRAWYGDKKMKCRKDGDFDFPSDQIVFWEHNDWHWGGQGLGVTNGTTINVCFIDGHVASKRIAASGYAASENPPGPLPRSGKGEPAWYNTDMTKVPLAANMIPQKWWDPHVYGDVLP